MVTSTAAAETGIDQQQIGEIISRALRSLRIPRAKHDEHLGTAWVAALEQVSSGRSASPVRLFYCVRDALLREMSEQQPHELAHDPRGREDDGQSAADAREYLAGKWKHLSELERDALWLVHWQDCSLAEAGQWLGMPKSTVHWTVQRAQEKLREAA